MDTLHKGDNDDDDDDDDDDDENHDHNNTCSFAALVHTFNSRKEYIHAIYEGWNFNSGNYLFTTDTK